MADQDFNINIRTVADLTGIKLTQEHLSALQTAAKQGNVEAINALKNLSNALKGAQSDAASTVVTASGIGGAVGAGVGTLLSSLIGVAVKQIQELDAQFERMVSDMIKGQEKSRELGLSIVDMFEAMKSAERIETEPLGASFDRLTYKVKELKTEMQLAFEAGRYEDVKKIAAALAVVEGQVSRVTSALERQYNQELKLAAERAKKREKDAKETDSLQENAVRSVDRQVKAVLRNEEAARQAREAGLERDADLYQKSAEQLKKSFTPLEAETYEALTKRGPVGRKAGVGESQELVDQMERNRINFERQLQGKPPLGPTEGGTPSVIDAIRQNTGKLQELIDLFR